jgi:DNA-binding transcriptional LysR family regulator
MDFQAIRKININQLKIFESVLRLKSMTLAAHELFLTQSGVSQHIKSLEDELGQSLFVRNKGELFPTAKAQILYGACLRSFRELEDSLQKISSLDQQTIEGPLRLGVPTEFGHNIVIPLLTRWAEFYPKVQIDFIYGYSTEMVHQLEKGQIDLAFIDLFKKNSKVTAHPVYTENLILVASEKYLQNKKINLKSGKAKWLDLMDLDYLEYQHAEPVLRMWFQHEFGKKNVPLQIRAWAMSVQGIASFVRHGLGAAVLPDHVVNQMNEEGAKVQTIQGPKGSLRNQISMAWSKKRPLSPAAFEFKKFVLKELGSD